MLDSAIGRGSPVVTHVTCIPILALAKPVSVLTAVTGMCLCVAPDIGPALLGAVMIVTIALSCLWAWFARVRYFPRPPCWPGLWPGVQADSTSRLTREPLFAIPTASHSHFSALAICVLHLSAALVS